MNYLARSQECAITPDAIIDERHHVVEELTGVLYAMPEEVFDVNGYSIVTINNPNRPLQGCTPSIRQYVFELVSSQR
jgi:hypothetical protein